MNSNEVDGITKPVFRERQRDEVRKMAEAELTFMSRIHTPSFNSMHEGYAILLEEFEELQSDMNDTSYGIKQLWEQIKSNGYEFDTEEKIKETLSNLELFSTNAIIEAVQVLAMIFKFQDLFKDSRN